MKISNWLMTLMVIAVSVIGCSKEDEMFPAPPEGTTVNPDDDLDESGDAGPYASRIYVMDVRFSRQTCATGPGVCFKDGFGNIWDYNFFDSWSDGEVGPIGVDLEEDQLHLAFYRSLEEETFIVDEDVVVSESLCRALGKSIVIKAGEYPVSYDRYEFGETSVAITSSR